MLSIKNFLIKADLTTQQQIFLSILKHASLFPARFKIALLSHSMSDVIPEKKQQTASCAHNFDSLLFQKETTYTLTD